MNNKLNSPLLVSAMLGLAPLMGPEGHSTPIPEVSPLPRKSYKIGTALGRGVAAGEPYTDSRGRRYVRDENGVVRRLP